MKCIHGIKDLHRVGTVPDLDLGEWALSRVAGSSFRASELNAHKGLCQEHNCSNQ